MRSLPIVHARPFAQPRLALRPFIDNLRTRRNAFGITTKRFALAVVVCLRTGEKPDEKLRRIFWGIGPAGCGYGSGLLLPAIRIRITIR